MDPRFRPLLAFDTATPTARVAVIGADGSSLASRAKTAARHSANLLSLVDEVLREAGVAVSGLGAIACGAGPGSFTGLRVGLAVAKGLALPTGVPLVLVSSLDALAFDLAEAQARATGFLPCLDAGKGQVYAHLYDRGAGGIPRPRPEPDWVVAPSELGRLGLGPDPAGAWVVGGNGLDRYVEVLRLTLAGAVLRTGVPAPSALAVARLAAERLAAGEQDDIATAVPRYGRPPDITRPKPRPSR